MQSSQLSPETPLLEFHRKACSTSSTWRGKGRSLLVLASQHGDEPCGVLAVNQLLLSSSQETTGGKVSSSSSSPWPSPSPSPPSSSSSSSSWPFSEHGCAFDSIVFALGNPRALAANRRQIDENLNRCFPIEKDLAGIVQGGSSSGSSYESHRASELAKLLSEADAVLDLHSASAPSPPFAMFPPSSPASASFARSLRGVPFALKDFSGEGLGLAIEWSARHGKNGKAAAVTLEAGQHSCPLAVEASVSAIWAALRWKGPGKEEEEAAATGGEDLVRPKVLVVKKGEVVRKGFRWDEALEERPPRAFTRFKFNDIVARDDVKGEMRCEVEKGALVVLPAAKPVEGEDAFLWGEEEEEGEGAAREEVEKTI